MRTTIWARRLAKVILCFFLSVGAVLAHEGEEHGQPVTPLSQEGMEPRLALISEEVELVAILRADRLWIYVDRYVTNEPISGLNIDVESPAVQPARAQVESEGIYSVAAPGLAEPGRYELTFTLQGAGIDDLLAGTLEIAAQAATPAIEQKRIDWRWLAAGAALFIALVWALRRRRSSATALVLSAFVLTGLLDARGVLAHEGEDHHPAQVDPSPISSTPSKRNPGGVAAQGMRLPDGSVYLPKPAQHIWGLRTIAAVSAQPPQILTLAGQVIADPNHSGRVAAIQPGILEAPADGFPTVGENVKKGAVLAYLRPSVSAVDAANRKTELALVNKDLFVKTQERDRMRGQVGARTAKEAVTSVYLERVEAEHTSLTARKTALEASLSARMPLTAPIAGVVSRSAAVIGAAIDAGEGLFEIITPQQLWIEAIAYDSGLTERLVSAQAITRDGTRVDLSFIGQGLRLQNESLTLQFRLLAAAVPLRVGQPVSVEMRTQVRMDGIALPAQSFTRGANGETLVWVHAEAERFIPRKVKAQSLNPSTSLAVTGVKIGERIVADRAWLLTQIR